VILTQDIVQISRIQELRNAGFDIAITKPVQISALRDLIMQIYAIRPTFMEYPKVGITRKKTKLQQLKSQKRTKSGLSSTFQSKPSSTGYFDKVHSENTSAFDKVSDPAIKILLIDKDGLMLEMFHDVIIGIVGSGVTFVEVDHLEALHACQNSSFALIIISFDISISGILVSRLKSLSGAEILVMIDSNREEENTKKSVHHLLFEKKEFSTLQVSKLLKSSMALAAIKPVIKLSDTTVFIAKKRTEAISPLNILIIDPSKTTLLLAKRAIASCDPNAQVQTRDDIQGALELSADVVIDAFFMAYNPGKT
jgi:hypothetical protein